ncbi:hypothetical protein [Myroides sp. DW712]|uniref:hypothetical protein n=1 Tax=Myroides sp. DW712 TaxID=3389800 RepID=UPI00397CB66A
MKKIHLKLGVLTLVTAGLIGTVSCSSDDHNYLTKVDIEIPGPEGPEEPSEGAEKATIKVEIVSVEEESVTFKLATTHAEKVHYLIEKKGVEVTVDQVKEQGVVVEDATAEQVAEGLEPEQEYVLYALAINKEDVITFDAKGVSFTTKKALDISLIISDVDATHERVIFTITPTGAVKMRYMVVEKSAMEGREMTAEEVMEEGFSIIKVDGPSTLKPKVTKPNTEYIIYVAGISASDTHLIVQEEVKTKDESEAPVDEELKVMTQMNFVGDEVGHTVAYDLYMSNDQWDVQFVVAAAQADEDILKEGRYIRNASQGLGRPGADEVGKSFQIKNKQTGDLDTDIDYGEIRIAKTSATAYKVEVDMVRKTDVTKRFKAVFEGVPVKGYPRP